MNSISSFSKHLSVLERTSPATGLRLRRQRSTRRPPLAVADRPMASRRRPTRRPAARMSRRHARRRRLQHPRAASPAPPSSRCCSPSSSAAARCCCFNLVARPRCSSAYVGAARPGPAHRRRAPGQGALPADGRAPARRPSVARLPAAALGQLSRRRPSASRRPMTSLTDPADRVATSSELARHRRPDPGRARPRPHALASGRCPRAAGSIRASGSSIRAVHRLEPDRAADAGRRGRGGASARRRRRSSPFPPSPTPGSCTTPRRSTSRPA